MTSWFVEQRHVYVSAINFIMIMMIKIMIRFIIIRSMVSADGKER